MLFKPQALFSNDNEVPDLSEMEAEDGLELAKARARTPAARPKCRSSIDIGIGEGRSTREVELIWWLSLYSSSPYGKLSLHFFIKKKL